MNRSMQASFGSRPVPGGGVEFELLGPWDPAAEEAFLASGADGLVINYARGFQGHDLEFLRGLPLRRVNVLARTISDLKPVESLADQLVELRLQTGHRSRIDLGLFSQLRALSCNWAQVAETIADCSSIEDLYLGEYDPEDLQPLTHLPNLRSLRMKDRPAIRRLDGFEALPKLSSLEIHLAPLDDLHALAETRSPVLHRLALGSCRAITELGPLQGLSSLRELDISESGSIESLQPLRSLAALEQLYLYGSTRVTDGDLTPLLGLTRLVDLRMMNRRHYAPSVRAVKESLGIE